MLNMCSQDDLVLGKTDMLRTHTQKKMKLLKASRLNRMLCKMINKN